MINYNIDYIDYNNKYIKNIKNVLLDRVCTKPSQNSIKDQNVHIKGTIPYYSEDANTSTTKHKKGTIPYYFPGLQGKAFFRA